MAMENLKKTNLSKDGHMLFGLSTFSPAVQVSCFCAFATAGAVYGITSAGKATLALFAECLFLVLSVSTS